MKQSYYSPIVASITYTAAPAAGKLTVDIRKNGVQDPNVAGPAAQRPCQGLGLVLTGMPSWTYTQTAGTATVLFTPGLSDYYLTGDPIKGILGRSVAISGN